MRNASLCACFLALLILPACGGGNQQPQFPDFGSPAGGGGAPAPTNFNSTLKGKIAFEGAAPAASKIQMSADPYCQQNSKNPLTEEVEVKDGGLQNVIVYISSGVPAGSYPAPSNPVLIDQHDCHYIPHVFTIQVGQTLKVKNSDATLHNIHAFSTTNKPFNFGQAIQNLETDVKFDKGEMPLAIRCDVHKWMNSFAGVFAHPFHAVSMEGGAYEFKLPAGQYEITAWHEKYGKQTQMVNVADNGTAELNFTFKPPTGD